MKTWYSSVTIENFKYYCIVLYCIMRLYTEGRLDRYGIDIPREMLYLKKNLSYMNHNTIIEIYVGKDNPEQDSPGKNNH